MKKCFSVFIAFMMAATILISPVEVSFANSNIGSNDSIKTEVLVEGLSETDVRLDRSEYIYTGAEIIPNITVTHNGSVLTLDQDYRIVEYINNINVGTATVVVEGINGYTGRVEKHFNIALFDFSEAEVSLNQTDWSYTGNFITPSVTVKYQGRILGSNDYDIKYSNNKYPGTATVTVTGKGDFSNASIEKTFYIARITSLKTATRGVTSIKLTWTAQKNVTGYVLYRKTSSGSYTRVATIKGSKNNTYTVKDLPTGTTQRFRVKAYVDAGDVNYYGGYRYLTTFTRPGQVTLTSVTTSPRLRAYVKWKKRNCSGYEVKLSRSSDFSNSDTYKITSPDTLQKTIKYLRNNKKYYVKVRAYKQYGNVISYGSWSKYKTFKSYDTGWTTLYGKRCYVKDAKVVHGPMKIGGNPYYFDRSTGEWRGVSYQMWSKVRNSSSGTKWLIAVSKSTHRVCVYSGSKGNWTLEKYWKCTTGAPGTPTPSGTFTVPKTNTYQYTFGRKDGYSVWYTTRIYKGYLFHSVLYTPGSKTQFLDGRLGYSLSHGCIRLSLSNAKWIQDNIRPGTKVIIY